jgi:putative membrane protein
MIVRNTPSKADLLFAVRGSIVPVIAPRVGFLVAMSALMVALHQQLGVFPAIDGFGFTSFGIALSLFLGFRNNAAYDRWWEARKLWGGLLADVRSIAREAEIFVQDAERRRGILWLALAFLHLHRRNLRGLDDNAGARSLPADLVAAPHPPCAALDRLSGEIASGHAAGGIDGFGARALAERVASMAVQQAGCERIASTPLPYVYSLLIYRTTYLYCLLLPLSLVEAAGWLTPVFVGVVAYVFLGLAEVSEELAHPFGTTPNALPLDAICRAAEISLAPHLGEPAPEPLQAQNFYLS